MAENSAIEWTDHTFNPWTGCTKVGPGCDHCYAEGWAKRAGLVEWGPHAERRRMSAANWAKPLKWERDGPAFFARHGRRQRVFCASLADVFDNAAPREWRHDLALLIKSTPALDWLLLTKRIGNAREMLDQMFAHAGAPANVWLGATVVNQAEADRDVPKLLATKAALGISVAFLSMEPLLGPVDLTRLRTLTGLNHDALTGRYGTFSGEQWGERVDWIIVGGESGHRARPMHPDWARSLRDQCAAADVPFLIKQWGEWANLPAAGLDIWDVDDHPEQSRFDHRDWTGSDWSEPYRPQWCDECDEDTVARIGKKAAGRLLDRVEHNGFPEVCHGR